MRPFNDLTGKKFGDLRVIAYAGTDKHRRRRWRVRCERCGYGVKVVLAANLLSGRTKTCGCVARYKSHRRLQALMRIEELFNLIGPEAVEGWAGEAAETMLAKLKAQGLKGEAAKLQWEAEMRALQ